MAAFTSPDTPVGQGLAHDLSGFICDKGCLDQAVADWSARLGAICQPDRLESAILIV
jgi:hypothetical protein